MACTMAFFSLFLFILCIEDILSADRKIESLTTSAYSVQGHSFFFDFFNVFGTVHI